MDKFKEMIIKMCEIRCKRCGRILKSRESIERGMGKTCWRISQLQQAKQSEQVDNTTLEELLNRVRKLELDNNFMKHQLNHKTFTKFSKDSELDWDIKPEIKKIINEYKIQFNVVVKELRVIFHENFDYHDVLNPINPIEEPIMVGIPA